MGDIILSRQNQNVKIKHSESILECIEYMSNNLDKKITVEDLAEMCFFSKAQFTRIFKKYTGASPYDYLIKLRINRAKRFLIETDLSLEEISSYTGFNGASHFIACFKKHENTTPYKYKNRYITKANSATSNFNNAILQIYYSSSFMLLF